MQEAQDHCQADEGVANAQVQVVAVQDGVACNLRGGAVGDAAGVLELQRVDDVAGKAEEGEQRDAAPERRLLQRRMASEGQ